MFVNKTWGSQTQVCITITWQDGFNKDCRAACQGF